MSDRAEFSPIDRHTGFECPSHEMRGVGTCDAIELFGKTHLDALQKMLRLFKGVPSHAMRGSKDTSHGSNPSPPPSGKPKWARALDGLKLATAKLSCQTSLLGRTTRNGTN